MKKAIYLLVSVLFFMTSCDKNNDSTGFIPAQGIWYGSYDLLKATSVENISVALSGVNTKFKQATDVPTVFDNDKAVSFYVAGLEISNSSLLESSSSMVVVIPFTNAIMKKFVYSEITILDDNFHIQGGNVSDVGGRLIVDGEFVSIDRCVGTVKYEENSTMYEANAEFDFTAEPDN